MNEENITNVELSESELNEIGFEVSEPEPSIIEFK